MSMHRDPELDDILQDEEMRRIADLLRSARRPEPPLDDAFRSALRRQLMQRAWGAGESRVPWWRRTIGPAGLAWVGAAAGVIIIASLVVFVATNPPGGGLSQLVITSPIANAPAVRLEQPILVEFNQPMNHASTEAAVQITPATTVAYSWQANTLSVQPTSGNLAPNTQYQVTIGSGAMTAAGQPLAAPQTITFVTQPKPAPSPSPTPSASAAPTPAKILTNEQVLADLNGAPIGTPQWSSDSSTIYFVNAKGALASVSVTGGPVTVLVPDGASSPALAPAGDQLAYIRNGKIEVIALGPGTTSELVVTPVATLVGWAKDKLVWAASDGIYTQGPAGQVQLAPLPAGGAVSAVSIAPDGTHAVYRQDQSLVVLDLATGKSSVLGDAGAQFLGWSPDATALIYSSAHGIVIADVQGKTVSTLPSGDPNWSSLGEILLGSDTDLSEIRPDGSGFTKLADGTYHMPVWAPNGTAFVYLRGGRLFTASAPLPPPQPAPLELASSVVNAFMQARLAAQPDKAATFLDDNGKQAYSGAGLNLLVTGDPSFSRYFVLSQEITKTQPLTATFVVRIVLAHGSLDVSSYDETLTLVTDVTGDRFFIDQASAGPRRDLGKGAEVVDVHVDPHSITITFDSDLVPGTVINGVQILDGSGKQIGDAPTYSNRTVTITSLDLVPGASYKLVVLTTVQDVSGNNIASEFDLNILGPAPTHGPGNHRETGAPPSPLPSPSPSASPSALPSPAS